MRSSAQHSAFNLKVRRVGNESSTPRPAHVAPKQPAPKVVDGSLRSRLFVLAAVLAFMATVCMVRSALIASHGYELVQVTQRAAQLENENKQLEMQIARLKSPQRIKRIAATSLGFVLPEEIYFGEPR